MKLEIKVFPKSKREEVVQTDAGIKVFVKAAPDKGKANKAVEVLLAKVYKVKKSCVKVVSGHRTQNKVVEVIRDE